MKNIISMNKEIKIEYKIKKIHTTTYAVEDLPEEESIELFRKGNSNLNIGSNINFDKENSTITIDIKTVLSKKSSKKELVKHTGRTVYYIQDLENLFNQEENSYKLPNNFLLQLLGISFSHTRALLATELKSTVYAEKFLLPVVNPKILLPKDLQ